MSHIDEGTLHAYLDGECRSAAREAVESHLAVCDACRARLDEARSEIESASGLLSHLEPGPVRGPTWHELEERATARSGVSGRDGSSGRRRWWRPGLAWAASVMIAFGAGWLAHSQGLEPFRPTADRPATLRSAVDRSAEAQPMEALPTAVNRTQLKSAVEATTQEPDRTAASRAAGGGEKANGAAAPPSPSEPATRERAATRDEAVSREDAVTREGAPAPVRRPETSQPETPTPRPGRTQAIAPVDSSTLTERQRGMLAREMERIRGEGRGIVREAIRISEFAGNESLAAQAKALPGGFFAVGADRAANWLGAPPRTIPDLQLRSVEVGPATGVEGGISGRPAIRLVYTDAAGHVITLTQQLDLSVTANRSAGESTLVVSPSGVNVYRWSDDGYRLTLSGPLGGDSLKALADRIR